MERTFKKIVIMRFHYYKLSVRVLLITILLFIRTSNVYSFHVPSSYSIIVRYNFNNKNNNNYNNNNKITSSNNNNNNKSYNLHKQAQHHQKLLLQQEIGRDDDFSPCNTTNKVDRLPVVIYNYCIIFLTSFVQKVRITKRFQFIKTTINKSKIKTIIQIIQCTLLIAGTTIGGGFLAVPQSILVPIQGNIVIAVTSLTVVWLFLLLQSIYLSDAIVDTWQFYNNENNNNNNNNNNNISTSTDINIDADTDTAPFVPGITSCVQNNFSSSSSFRGVALITGTILFTLTIATLVSQISRAGSIYVGLLQQQQQQQQATTIMTTVTTTTTTKVQQQLTSSLSMEHNSLTYYRLGCIIAASIGGIISFTYSGSSIVTSINSVLTTIFLASATILFYTGSKIANWDMSFLTSSSSVSSIPWMGIKQAIPTMLQLLVYGEIIPTVCSILQYNKRSIHYAIFFGSFIPLVLLSGWSALAIGLLPKIITNQIILYDPVDVLLKQGGILSTSLYILAISAIGTTILGCNLALESNYNDMISILFPSKVSLLSNNNNNNNAATGASSNTNKRLFSIFMKSNFVKYCIIWLLPLLISNISPKLFLQAIDFAGTYPVLLLFGILPSMIRIRSTTRTGTIVRTKKKRFLSLSVSTSVPYLLLLLSMSWLGMECTSNCQSFFSSFISKLK